MGVKKRKGYIFQSPPIGGSTAEAFQSLFSYIDWKFRDGCGEDGIRLICDMRPVLIPRCDVVGKPQKKTYYRSGGTGVRTRDLSNAKWRARRLATVVGGWESSELLSESRARLKLMPSEGRRDKAIWGQEHHLHSSRFISINRIQPKRMIRFGERVLLHKSEAMQNLTTALHSPTCKSYERRAVGKSGPVPTSSGDYHRRYYSELLNFPAERSRPIEPNPAKDKHITSPRAKSEYIVLGPNFAELGIVSRTERAASLLAKSGKFSGGKQGSQCLSPTPKRIRVARLLFKSGEQSCVSNSGVLLSRFISRSNLEGDVAASSGGKFPPNFAINYKPETQSGRIFRRQSDPASGLSVGN
ncbi:hypothetical protein GEV33_009726 [Tenebrio molitor]|uniref:Uncharacterized protein n=1 Tax=Tenebrio molitor TaxID=7067 RepID=A0A8J6L9F9_TENMO|nr:hypothetical protein GEV33_009726 [Tenebrio molitor]